MSRSFLGLVLLGTLSTSAFASAPGDSCSLEGGQRHIDHGRYNAAVATFSCVLQADPMELDAYRGRAEAELLLGRYADAYHEYALAIATIQPDDIYALGAEVLDGYDARLASPDKATLTGASFARWVFWEYDAALPLFDALLAADPGNGYARLFRGSTRLFAGTKVTAGRLDLEVALLLDPANPHVRYVVADAYTYAYPNPDRAWREASRALQWGLDTPRVHAILASVLNGDGDEVGAAQHIDRHIDLVTTQVMTTTPLAVGATKTLALWPGLTHEIPVYAVAGSTIAIETGSPSDQIWDSIAVLLDPAGHPVVGADDTIDYFAAIDWVAPTTGTYTLRVTSFEAINTGPLTVTRD